MKTLKELLGEELHKQVVEKTPELQLVIIEKGQKAFIHKEGETPIITNNGEWIPKEKFNNKLDEIKTLKAETETYKSEVGNLKKLAGDNEEMKTKITSLESDIEANKTESGKRETDIAKKFAVKDALRDAKVKHPALLLKEIDLEKIELDSDGKVRHIDDHIKPLKEQYPDLFGEVKLKGNDPLKPTDLPDGHITKEQFMNWSESERAANIDKVNESSKHWK